MKKLIEALHIIQDTCALNKNCADCPLSSGNACAVTDTDPDNWKINDEVQKALL